MKRITPLVIWGKLSSIQRFDHRVYVIGQNIVKYLRGRKDRMAKFISIASKLHSIAISASRFR